MSSSNSKSRSALKKASSSDVPNTSLESTSLDLDDNMSLLAQLEDALESNNKVEVSCKQILTKSQGQELASEDKGNLKTEKLPKRKAKLKNKDSSLSQDKSDNKSKKKSTDHNYDDISPIKAKSKKRTIKDDNDELIVDESSDILNRASASNTSSDDKQVAVDLNHTDDISVNEVLFGSLSRSGIGISKALLQGTRLQSIHKSSGKSDNLGEGGLNNPFLNSDPHSLLADKITHISGKTLDLGALIHDLKELDPDLIKAANQEGLSGFAGAANDLLLFRKLEDLGATQFCNLTIGQLRSLIKKSIPQLSDKIILECYQCFKSCIKNGELEQKVKDLAKKYQVTIPHQSIEAFLFSDDSDYQGDEGLIAIRKLVINTYCNYEDEILKLVKIFDIKNTQFSKAYDEVTFYQYVIASKSGKEQDFRVYEALVKLKNHIELFILMRGAFIKTHDFAIFSDSELVSYIYDDESIFEQHSYHSAKELAQLDPCGMHFCYLESVLNLILSTNSARELLLNFIKKFGQIYINKACSKFFNPTMGFEFDFIPSLLSYMQGLYASLVGDKAFNEASQKVNDLEKVPLFFYELFLNDEHVSNTPEYQIACDKFKDKMASCISNHNFSDEMKEWATHIYHQESIYRATKDIIGSIVTCGHPISKDENYLNDQVSFEIMAFYSKYLINLERKKIYQKLEQENESLSHEVDDDNSALYHESLEDANFNDSEDYDSDFWLLGDNGFVPLIPGMPALTAFLIGRAYTYGELMWEQNNTLGFSALTYADYSGNYLASTYLAHYYQSLFDSKINAQGQLFFLYHMRAILSFHLGMTSIELPYSSLKLYHNYDFHISHKDKELYFDALKKQDDSWARLFKKNPTLGTGSRFEGRQPLLSTVFGTIVGNSLIYLCDLIEQNPKFGDFYHNSLLLLINLLERCLKAEYNPVGCFAMYRLLKTNLKGNTFGIEDCSFEKYFPHSSASALLFHQLFANGVKSPSFDDLIGPEFNSDDIANMFLQVGMLSSAHREQGYNLLNHHLSSYKGNFAPLTEPYLDELYRTSAGLGNGNSLSYLSQSASCLNHEDDSELYALMGARIQAGHLYKKLSHYFIKNDMKTERRRLTHQMFFMHRPYGFYDSYLVLKDRPERVNEAHTFLFYAACMSVPEAISDLEALEKAHLFKPLPFVVYLKYLEQLAKTKVEALLTLRLLSQSGGILPVNSFYFIKYLEHNHAFFSNSMLKKTLLDTGQIDLALGSELYSLQSSSCSELFKDEQEYLRLNSYDMEGNFATYHQLLEREFSVEYFNAHNIGDTVVEETVTKMFDSLVAGKTQLERAILLNWRMADNFPRYLQEKAQALSISVESEHDFATIDSVMAAYRAALDTYPLSLSISLCTQKAGAHILDSNKSIENVVNSLVRSEIISTTLETMYAFALNAIRGRGRPSPQHFLNLCRYLANTGDAAAMRYSHICMDPLNVVPYGQTFNECVLEAYEKDVAYWSEHFAKKYFDGQLLERIVESASARKERDMILKAIDQSSRDLSNISAINLSSDDVNGYGNDINSIIYSDINRDYLKLSLENYQELIKFYQRQENHINNLIAQDSQESATVFSAHYIKNLQQLNDEYWANHSAKSQDDVLDNQDNFLEVYSSTATNVLKSTRFDPKQLFNLIEPVLAPNQKIELTIDAKSKIYIKSFLDFAYFMKGMGWNIVQSLVGSRNGWQLARKSNGPERSFASLLAKDMLTGAPGARERFLYYTQSHGFKYHLNSAYFKEDDSSQTARNFVTQVLQIDLKSPKFEEFSQSMDSEGFPEFKALLLEKANGYIEGRPRISIDGFEYDAQSGYSSLVNDLAPDLVLSSGQAIKARDELRQIVSTLNDLATKEQTLKSHYFTCSDRIMDANYGDNSKVLRAMIERIVGVENIERLNSNDKPYLSYSFYDDKSIGAHDMLKMLDISCSILPYRLIRSLDPKSRSMVLKHSGKMEHHEHNQDLNIMDLYGIEQDYATSRWHMSKEQLLNQEPNDISFINGKLNDSLHSSYANALYQEDRLCVNLAMLYENYKKHELSKESSFNDSFDKQNLLQAKDEVNGAVDAIDNVTTNSTNKNNHALYSSSSSSDAYKRHQSKAHAWSQDLSFNHHDILDKSLFDESSISDDIVSELNKHVDNDINTKIAQSHKINLKNKLAAKSYDSDDLLVKHVTSDHDYHDNVVIEEKHHFDNNRVASNELSNGEKKLLECILSNKEYHGSLLSRRYAIASKQVLKQAKIANYQDNHSAMIIKDSALDDNNKLAPKLNLDSVDLPHDNSASDKVYDFLPHDKDHKKDHHLKFSDEITSERSLDESMIYDRLKTFLGSNLSFGSDNSFKLDGYESNQNLNLDQDYYQDSDPSKRRLQQILSDPSSILGMIFSRVWDFDESKEEQYTRPAMFYEDENPLHVYIYLLLNLVNAHENYEVRLVNEERYLDYLYAQGYFYGCSDLIDCAFKHTVYESYRYRFERSAVSKEVSSSISNLAGSILERLLSQDDLDSFYQADLNEVNDQTKKVAQYFKMPSTTPKRYLLEGLINYSDEHVTKRSRYYKALISATSEQLQAHNYEVMLDDSLQHQAFYDLFNCQSMLSCAPNVMHWLYQHNFKGMDISSIDPRTIIWPANSTYTKGLAKSIQSDNYVNPTDEQVSIATGLLVDSPELGYQNVKLAKFHSSLSKEQDCRRYSYIELIYGSGMRYEHLDKAKRNQLDALTLKFINMQDVLQIAISLKNHELMPFVPEYIYSGLAIGDDRPWTNRYEEVCSILEQQCKELYNYQPLRGSALSCYRYSIAFDESDKEFYESYFEQNPLNTGIGDKDLVDKLIFSGRHKDALAIHNMLLDQLENSQANQEIEDIDDRLAAYEYAQILGLKYFVYDSDNYSDIMANVIISNVCPPKDIAFTNNGSQNASACSISQNSIGMYVPVDDELLLDKDDEQYDNQIWSDEEFYLDEDETLDKIMSLDQESKKDESIDKDESNETYEIDNELDDSESLDSLLDTNIIKDSENNNTYDLSGIYLTTQSQGKASNYQDGLAQEYEEQNKQNRLKYGPSPLRDIQKEQPIDGEFYYSGYDDLEYLGYDNYGDCYDDITNFEKKILNKELAYKKKKAKTSSTKSATDSYEHMSLEELLQGADIKSVPIEPQSYQDSWDEVDDDDELYDEQDTMIMSYDQMESFSKFLHDQNINPMDIEGIADALVKNHFEILDQKGLSHDDLARAIRENSFDFDEQSALNEIDQQSSYRLHKEHEEQNLLEQKAATTQSKAKSKSKAKANKSDSDNSYNDKDKEKAKTTAKKTATKATKNS